MGYSSAWGGLWVEYNDTPEPAFGGATPSKVTAWQALMGVNHDTHLSADENGLILPRAGEYFFSLSGLSFSGTNSKQYHGEIFVGARHSLYGFRAKTGSAGNVESASCCGLITADEGDEVALYMWSTDGGTILTVAEAQLVVFRMPER